MSSNYLPDVVMPEEEPEKPTEESNADPLVSRADGSEGSVKMEIDETEEENPNFVYSDDEVEGPIEEDEPEPVVKPKRKLKNEEVFSTPKIQPVQEPVKEKKKRKPPTQKQLDALAKARETMKANREEKARLKAEGKDVPKSKAKQKQENKVKAVIQEQGQLYTQEQISEMVESGIQKYEVKRKARKVVKVKQKEDDAQQLQVQRQVQRAMGTPAQDDIWGQALAGLI
tara:strand:+ start:469 stop:1152 length:684 start_codon:yes stop_codon:yes gene_type:complete